jgi:ribonuclease BN (tRNA processing enzyme)
MTLTMRVLGTGTPYPRPGSPCSGYLLDASGTLVLVELGLSVWPALLAHADPGEVAAIWISHLHPDHCGDLLAAYQWAANTRGAARLRIYGPPGWAHRIGTALPAPDGPDQLRQLFDVREHTKRPEQLRSLQMAAVAVRHSVPTWGLRLTHDRATLAYSGDSGPCAALTKLASGADTFLCEAGTTTPGNPYHCTPEEAALAAASANRLVLTHLAPELTPAEASRRAGGTPIARPGDIITCA